jgi:hypothetical protein
MFLLDINGTIRFYHDKSKKIDLSFSDIYDLPDFSSLIFLQELILDHNFIKFLNFKKLPKSLKYLYINYNNIESIENIPKNLEILYCSNNFIKTINLKGSNLIIFDCSFNQIKNIDYLPNSLLTLICSNNDLTNLNNLNSNLKLLNATENQLISFDLKFWIGVSILKNIYFITKYGLKVRKYFYKFISSRKYNLHLELLYKPELGFYKLQWNEETLKYIV